MALTKISPFRPSVVDHGCGFSMMKTMAKPMTLEELAGMVKTGFDGVDKRFEDLTSEMNGRFATVDERFDQMDARFDRMDERFDHVDARLGRLEADMSELRGEVVYRHEFDDALARIKYLEKKLGIETGA